MKYSKDQKQDFIQRMKVRTKRLAVEIIRFTDGLPKNQAGRVISYQIIKSATSMGANYRAACRGRSKAEFHSKISITVEETDETQYWLEIIEEANLHNNQVELKRLHKETSEILAIVTTARKNNN